jgi:hypothetical protein
MSPDGHTTRLTVNGAPAEVSLPPRTPGRQWTLPVQEPPVPMSQFHSEPTCAQVAPEMLTKHAFDIRLTVDHENIGGHFASPGFVSAGAASGGVKRICAVKPPD